MNISKKDFAEKILGPVRKECENQGITQGAIVVSFVDSSKNSDDYVFPVIKGKDTIYREADGHEAGDCADVAKAKNAAALKSIEHFTAIKTFPGRSKFTSGALPDELVGDGMSNWKGAIGVPIGVRVCGGCGCHGCGYRGISWFTICVAVSGGKQEQDEAAAWAALNVIREVIHGEFNCMLRKDFYEEYDCVDGDVDRLPESSED